MPRAHYKNIGFVIRPTDSEDLFNLIESLVKWLSRRKKNVFLLSKEKSRLKRHIQSEAYKKINFIAANDLFKKPDLIISLGGDGTLIGVSRRSNGKVPIVGVNKGRLGFITEFQQSEVFEYFEDILARKFDVVNKPLFKISVKRNKKQVFSSQFFNDAVFSKNDISRMFSLSIDSNKGNIFDVSGDGLIISSTIGSTAYSLAAGGPIVQPEVAALILNPINPHSLTHRPIVISDTSKLKVRISRKERSVLLTLDGQEVYEIMEGDEVRVQRSSRSVLFVSNPHKNYFRTLREKFIKPRTG